MSFAPRYFTVDETPLDQILTGIHERWFHDVRRLLRAALLPGADAEAVAAGTRYLDGEFKRWFERERDLVGELDPLLHPRDVGMLHDNAALLERARQQLQALASRGVRLEEVRTAAGALTDVLQLWCAELELAVRGISHQETSHEARRILAELEAAAHRPGLPIRGAG